MDFYSRKQPREKVTLEFTLGYDGTSANETRGVTAVVYDPNGSQISGSPFTLTHSNDGQYIKADAFSADIVGTYRVVFKVWTDTGLTEQDLNFSRGSGIVEVQYEEIGGFGGGNVELPENFIEDIAERVWRFDTSKIKNDRTAIRQILSKLNIEIPKVDFVPLLNAIDKLPKKPDLTESLNSVARKSDIPDVSFMKEAIESMPSKSDLPDVEKVVHALVRENEQLKSTLRVVVDGIKAVDDKVSSISDERQISILGKVVKLLDKVSKKEMSVNVDIKQFVNEISKVSKHDKNEILNKVLKHVDKRTEKKEMISLLERILSSMPDVDGVMTKLDNMDFAMRERLKFVMAEILSKAKRNVNVSPERISIGKTQNEKSIDNFISKFVPNNRG